MPWTRKAQVFGVLASIAGAAWMGCEYAGVSGSSQGVGMTVTLLGLAVFVIGRLGKA